jgi:hypothetical protein
VLAVGLGLAWSRWVSGAGPGPSPSRGRVVAAALVLLAITSAALAWRHVLAVWA